MLEKLLQSGSGIMSILILLFLVLKETKLLDFFNNRKKQSEESKRKNIEVEAMTEKVMFEMWTQREDNLMKRQEIMAEKFANTVNECMKTLTRIETSHEKDRENEQAHCVSCKAEAVGIWKECQKDIKEINTEIKKVSNEVSLAVENTFLNGGKIYYEWMENIY